MSIFDDVRGMDEGPLTERTDRAAMTVCSKDPEAKLVLVQAVAGLAGGIPANSDVRADTGRGQISDAAADLDEHHSLLWPILDDIDGCR